MVESEIELVAMRSTLPGSGEVKLSVFVMQKLEVKEGQAVEVVYGRKRIKGIVVEDDIYTEKGVRIREADLKALDVRPGRVVKVIPEGNTASRPAPKKKTTPKKKKNSKKKSGKKKSSSKKTKSKKGKQKKSNKQRTL
jgi:antitoxin component of MazEF toxin-antitoxin module